MRHKPGFTLVELLVVVSIIVVLIALLIPSMESAVELARRAQCAGNERVVGVSTLGYARDNLGQIIPTRRRNVTVHFSPGGAFDAKTPDRQVDWIAALASAGLFTREKKLQTGFDGSVTYDHAPLPIWSCPSVPFPAGYFALTSADSAEDAIDAPDDRHFNITYQYYGGVKKWNRRSHKDDLPAFRDPARSPRQVSTAHGGWVLMADAAVILDGNLPTPAWSGPSNAFFGLPAHKDSPHPWSAGGNHLTFDGAVQWKTLDEMALVHSWSPGRRLLFMSQGDLGGWRPHAEAMGSHFKK